LDLFHDYANNVALYPKLHEYSRAPPICRPSCWTRTPAATFVIIDEVEMDNWGVNRENVTTLRQRQAQERAAAKPL